MNSYWSRTAALAVLFVSTLAGAVEELPIHSLSDLPRAWRGMAGDLFTKVPAQLVFEKITPVSRDESASGFRATYEVKGNLIFGDRKLELKEVHLSVSNTPSIYEIAFFTRDELVSRLFATIKYNETSQRFLLKELPRQGREKRFSLEGDAARE